MKYHTWYFHIYNLCTCSTCLHKSFNASKYNKFQWHWNRIYRTT